MYYIINKIEKIKNNKNKVNKIIFFYKNWKKDIFHSTMQRSGFKMIILPFSII